MQGELHQRCVTFAKNKDYPLLGAPWLSQHVSQEERGLGTQLMGSREGTNMARASKLRNSIFRTSKFRNLENF